MNNSINNSSEKLIFVRPEWLKKNLGTVKERIGHNGNIHIEGDHDDKIILKLTKEDSTFELIPASVALSKLIKEGEVNLSDIENYKILELNGGYICISNGSNVTTIDCRTR